LAALSGSVPLIDKSFEEMVCLWRLYIIKDGCI